ncbi:hypothetical protein Tco_0620283 [Tanacetum coccineum]
MSTSSLMAEKTVHNLTILLRIIFSDDSSSSSSSSSSSKTSSDSSADALSDSASSRSSSDHSLLASPSGTRSSHHLCSLRSRSPVASVSLSSPTLRALSYARADLLPSPKRIRSPETATDLRGCSEDSFEPYVLREAGLGRSDGIKIDPEVQAEIDECFAYADALRDRGIDARVVVKAIDREEIETGIRGPVEEGAVEVTYKTLGDLVQRFHDHTEEILVRRVQVIESVQRDQGHRIITTGQQSVDMLERIRELERDNMRLRDIVDVESQRVTRFRRSELRVQRETMPNTRSGASRTLEGINEQIDRQMAGALGARTTARNLEPLMRDGGGQEEVNGNGGNMDG